ncbi:MAG TPA: general secretion pathway protein GspF [Gammaproteobacteria bacterium]|nr:general secretion pathway protein GspF [Gammaproteobacteria bacterium]
MLGRPKTAEEYVDLVDQALFEIEELRLAAEYDMESMGAATEFLSDLQRDVQKLRDSMADGSYRFGKEDLPYVKVVEHQDERILPFKQLLLKINETHIEGLDVEGDED